MRARSSAMGEQQLAAIEQHACGSEWPPRSLTWADTGCIGSDGDQNWGKG